MRNALILMLLLAAQAQATPVPLQFTAPCYDAPPAHPDTACGFTSGTFPLTGLKEARIYVWRFDEPGDTLVLTIPLGDAVSCQNIPFDLDVEPGTMGEAIITAVDWVGNESCVGSHSVFAVPATDFNAGLWGEYYDNQDLTGFRFTRADPQVNFDWGSGSPDPSVAPDSFSERWTGFVRSTVSGTYSFCTDANDGVRLWVNSVPIVDRWLNGVAEDCGSITLTGGMDNAIVLEHYEGTGSAKIILRWTPPGGTKAVIPATAFSY